MNHEQDMSPGKSFILKFTAVTALLTALASAGACMPGPTRAHNKSSAMVQMLTESDNNRTLAIHPGDTLRITLPENATTGYRWQLDRCERDIVGVVAQEPHYNSTVVGSGGMVEFVLQGRKAGACEIVFKHWRSWEGDSSVIARFRLKVNVLP
jgi:inhibitor of cysteine peptidase